MNGNFDKAIKECLENGQRLMDEAQLLEFENPPSRKYFLSMVAQEEFAKGFFLYLVSIGSIPWNALALRASRDHKCKQLLGIIIDYLAPDWDEFLTRLDVAKVDNKWPGMPARVADAINILRHEKIGRWQSARWVWEEDPSYDKVASQIADGKLDREKQNSLYVGVGNTGQVISTPKRVAEEKANEEFQRSSRFASFIENLIQGSGRSDVDYGRVEKAFRTLFADQGENSLGK